MADKNFRETTIKCPKLEYSQNSSNQRARTNRKELVFCKISSKSHKSSLASHRESEREGHKWEETSGRDREFVNKYDRKYGTDDGDTINDVKYER